MTTADRIREARRLDLRERAETKAICKVCRFCGKHCEHPPGQPGNTFPEGTLSGLCGACIGGEGYRDGFDRWGVWHGPAVPLGTAPDTDDPSDCALNVSGFRELYDAASGLLFGREHKVDHDWKRLRAAVDGCCKVAPDLPENR